MILSSGQHAIRTLDQAYDGVEMLTEPLALEALSDEAQVVRRVLVEVMEAKRLEQATKKAERISALFVSEA